MRTVTIHENGVIDVAPDTDVTLRWLQQQCGGYIDAIRLRDASGNDVATMYVNDEYRLVDEPVLNIAATAVARHYGAIWNDDWVGGNVAIVGPVGPDGDDTELAEATMHDVLLAAVGAHRQSVRVAPSFWQGAAEAVFQGVPVIVVDPGDLLRPENDR